jgi:hypothetical protein
MLIKHGAWIPGPKTCRWEQWALAAYYAGPDRWADIPEIQKLMESSYDGNQAKLLSQKPLLYALRFKYLAMSTFCLNQCITPVGDLGSFFGYCPADEPVHDKTRHGREQLDWSRDKAREQWHYFGRPNENPLWWAVYFGEEEIVEKLLRRGAGTNSLTHCSPQREPRNMISLALHQKYYGIAELLLDYGTDPSYQFLDGSLLRRALEIGNARLVMKVLSSLKRHGARNIANYVGYVAIEIGKQNAALVKILLDFGADPNAEVFYHRPEVMHKELLSLAIEIGNQDVVETLLEYGASSSCNQKVHQQGSNN